MKKIAAALVLALAMANAAQPSQAQPPTPTPPPPAGPTSTPAGASVTTVMVPAGTAIKVHIVGTISSSSAKKGDVFQIQAADDVVVDGMIVIPKGAGGEGTIVDSNSAGGNGHSGSLGLSFSYIHSADGGKVRLTDAAQTQAEEDRKGASSTATIIGYAFFGLGGLFGHNLAHGRQKTIDEATIITTFVEENVHVDATEHGEHFDK